MKICVRCEEKKNFSKFSKRKASKDSLHPYCKDCVSKIMKIYGEKESVKNRNKEWKNKNPEKVKLHAKKTYEKNRKTRIEKIHVYNEKNRKKINEKARSYYEKNKNKINKKQNAYRATEKGKKESNNYYHRTKQRFDTKKKARNKLRYAIKVGKVIKPENCEKCLEKRKLHGHHEDYNNPLHVIWVCNPCHTKIHFYKGN